MDAVSGEKSFTINEWRVDPALNRLSRAGDVIKIDPQNMKVLELLASRPGELISQPEIEQLAWSGVIVTADSVYQSIAQLRRALGDDKTNPKYIETIARKGYRLVAEVFSGPPKPLATEPDTQQIREGTKEGERFDRRRICGRSPVSLLCTDGGSEYSREKRICGTPTPHRILG